jgi:hypothetical protein
MFEEVPIELTNQHLMRALLVELEEDMKKQQVLGYAVFSVFPIAHHMASKMIYSFSFSRTSAWTCRRTPSSRRTSRI